MSERTRTGGLVGPVLLIGLGAIFLLNNLGILTWSVWDLVFRLWPLILIAIGLDLLVGGRSVWGSLLALVLILAVFIGGVFLMGIQFEAAIPAGEIRQPLGGLTEAEVAIGPAVGLFRVVALEEGSGDLVQGEVRLGRGESLRSDFDRERDPARFTLKSSGFAWFPTSGMWGTKTATWDLSLNPDVPLSLDLSLGVGMLEINLGELILTDLDVSLGIGKSTITLPGEGSFKAKIDGAIGQTIVVIPRGMAARILVSTGLGTSQMPAGYSRQGDYYISPGYGTAENRVDLEIGQAIGLIQVISLER